MSGRATLRVPPLYVNGRYLPVYLGYSALIVSYGQPSSIRTELGDVTRRVEATKMRITRQFIDLRPKAISPKL